VHIRTPHDLAVLCRGRRLDLGWSQVDVATRAGVSRKWVSDFETGKTSADLRTVLRLLGILEVSLVASAATGSATPRAAGDSMDLDEVLDRYLHH
jgi:HTH-type transcriptional regulator/antitoxin HipB